MYRIQWDILCVCVCVYVSISDAIILLLGRLLLLLHQIVLLCAIVQIVRGSPQVQQFALIATAALCNVMNGLGSAENAPRVQDHVQ